MSKKWAVRGGLAVAALAMVAALVCAIVFSVAWFSAYREQSASDKVAKARTAAVEAGNQVLINSQSMDAADPQKYFTRLQSVLTPDALKAVDPQASIDLIKQSGVTTTQVRTVILHTAVSSLDEPKGAASLLIFADVNATDKGKLVRSSRSAFVVDMVRTDDKWLGSGIRPLDSVPVSESGGN